MNTFLRSKLFNGLKIRCMALALLLICVVGVSRGQIAFDGLNNSTTVFNLTGTGGYYSGNSAAGDRPATSAFAVEGTNSYGVSNGTAVLTSNNINTSLYTGISLSFRVAAFSINSTGNGMDAGDIVTVEISPDGGTNYYSTVRVLGNANAYWAYSATGLASTSYDGNAVPVDFAPAAGGSRTTDGYSTVTISGLPTTSNLRVRITLLNNSANELWVVDNFTVSGTLGCTAPSAPVALTATAIGDTYFTANWNTSVGATGYYVDVYQLLASTNLANWTFPVSGTTVTPDAGSANNTTQTLTVNGGTGAIVSSAGSTTQAASATGWNTGSGTKYWQIDLNTIGFTGITVSSKQRSSNTGPRDFGLEYRVGAGAWTAVTGGTITVADDFTTGVLTNVALPAACENQSAVSLRWIMTSNTAVGGAGVAGGGTSRIDDIFITGTGINYLSGWQNVYTTANFLEVTGVNPLTAYYYVVRADNGSCSSVNSNQISVTTTPSCTPSATITSFQPASGPQGTLVTITGTGFTGATAVKFGTVNATSFTVVNSTTIIAEVPANTPTDKVRVTVSACDAVSASNFTFLSQSGTCGTTGTPASNLFISEVYDAESGSLSYIEITNVTGAAVNLTNYSVRIRTGAGVDVDYSLGTGTLNNNSVFILSVGTSAITCSSVAANISYPTGSGFNGNDRIYLRQSGVDIDYVPNPNYPGSTNPGFSQIRRANATAPSTTYISSDWTISTTESCTDLGTSPYSTTAATITISSHPSDVSGCNSISFTVNATSSPTPPPTYLWKYNDPSSMTGWSNASTIPNVTVSGSSTATLTITGNTADLLNYQFYCELQEGSCIQNTNAAQYTYNTAAYYRTTGSGLWTNPAIWEVSNAEAGPYVAACQYPVATNSVKVNILNTHTVTLDVIDVSIDWVDINSGGALTIGSSSMLTFNNGNSGGADFEVNGTLTDGGSNANGIDFNTGATWQLGTNATVIRNNASQAGVYRDNYHTGMVNIPASANWIIRGSSTVNVPFTTINTFYPNLIFESTSGLWSPSAATTSSRFTGTTGGFATVKGNLDIGGTGAGTVTVFNENTNATALQVLGNLTVRSGSTLTNNGNASGTGFEVRGNVSVAGTLTVNGTAGNAGTLIMSGTTPQSISGAGTYNLYNFTVNNSGAIGAGSGVTLNRALSMDGLLNLINGLVHTTSTNLLSLTATATTPAGGGGDSAAFVNGPMRKTGTAAFEFPVGRLVGSEGYYGMIGINAVASTTTFEALFYRANAALLGPVQLPLVRVSFCEYWDLTRISGTEDVLVTLSWTPRSRCAVSYINNINAVVVANLNSSSTWINRFGANRTGDGNAGTVQATAIPLAYPRFALGTTDISQAPLPVLLNTFTATSKQTAVTLDWTVGNNHQQQQYVLERSSDGRNFETITTVNAKQGLTLADYSFDDAKPLSGWNYYRLRARDLENKTNTSTIIKVWWGRAAAVNILPNPASEKIVINLSAPSSIKEIQIVNAMGQVVRTITTVQFFNEVNISSLQAGMYYIRFLGESGLTTKSFVKQ